MKIRKIELLLSIAMFAAGCSKDSTTTATTTSTYSADKPSAVMGVVATSISTAGSGLSGSTTSSLSAEGLFNSKGANRPMLASTDCDTHGDPATVTDRSSSSYAGLLTYCKMTTDTGDEESVQGVFSGIKDIACMVENAGPTYDGTAHDLTLTFDPKISVANSGDSSRR